MRKAALVLIGTLKADIVALTLEKMDSVPVRIVFVCVNNPFGKGPFGGAESSIGLLARMLASRGHLITFVTSGPTAAENIIGAVAKIKFVYFRKFRGTLSEPTSFLTNFSVAIALRQSCQTPQDIIYFSYEPNILAALTDYRKIWHRGGTPPKTMLRIAGEYWSELTRKQPKFNKKFERWFNQFDTINFISEALVERSKILLLKHEMDVRIDPAFVQDIGSSVNIGRNVPYQEFQSGSFQIVMAGRFANYAKRQDLLIEAISKMSNFKNLQVTFFGSGPRKEMCIKMVADLGLQAHISFKDFVPQEQLWQAFQDAHLLCHIADHEGLCKTVIEAMAVGTPVLCSDIRPFNDYVNDGVNGFLTVNDSSKIADHLTALIKNSSGLARASQEAMQTIQTLYDPEKNVVSYEKAFQRSIANEQ